MELTVAEKERLLDSIYDTLVSKGLKGTTMDSVASTLGMSKRTLYDIFPDKREMIYEVLRHAGKKESQYHKEVLANSPDVLTAMTMLIDSQMKKMQAVNVNLFRDLDNIFKDLRHSLDSINAMRHEQIMHVINMGIEQGVFRKGLNYEVLLRMFSVQMESLKRMEEVFPKELTLAEVYGTIAISFLRSIATIKGIEILDNK